MKLHGTGFWLRSSVVACVALALLAAACAPAQQPAAQAPAKPAAEPAKPAAQPAKPAAQPAKPAAEPAKPAAQPAKPAASEEPDAALVEAAKKEGKVVWYTSLELTRAKKLADLFEKKYGIPVEVVRSGSERIFAQFMKEQETNVKKADVVHTSDASNFLTMRDKGLLQPYRPKAAAAFTPALAKQTMAADDTWFVLRMSPWTITYNTNKVKDAEAPKAWKDLLDPKWKGKLVHPHPGYSGSTLTVVYQIEKTLGTDFYRQLAKNEPLIVQSAVDVPAKVIAGERDIGAGGLHYNAFPEMKKGGPIKSIAPADGTILIASPQAIAKNAVNPNAAKLFQEFTLGREGQQYLVDEGLHSVRGDVKYPEGQMDLTKMKLEFVDAAAVEKARENVIKMFKDVFGV